MIQSRFTDSKKYDHKIEIFLPMLAAGSDFWWDFLFSVPAAGADFGDIFLIWPAIF